VFHPRLHGGNLLLELGGVGGAEVVADGGAAHVETQAGTLAFQMGQVRGRGFGEVVGGEFHRVQIHAGAGVNEIVEAHGRLRLRLQIEVLAVAVGGDAQAEVRFAG